MMQKFISILVTTIFFLGQPLEVLAQQDLWPGYGNPAAGGLGFYPYQSPRFPGEASYVLRGAQGTLWLTEDSIWLTQLEAAPVLQKGEAQSLQKLGGVNLKLSFPGANPSVQISVEQRMAGHVSILKGEDSANWAADLPLWGLVRYHDLYPGVDLVVRSTENGFAWGYEAQPGASIAGLQMKVEGAESVKVESSGTLIETVVGQIPLPPLQLEGAALTSIAAPSADAAVIYPVSGSVLPDALDPAAKLAYSTYLGGSSWDVAYDVALDASGAAYIVGNTASADFPVTPGAFDGTLAQTDAFVVKLSPQSASPAYVTFIGGGNLETGWSVAVSGGVAYISGETGSYDFPVTDAANLFAGETDAFVTAINTTGTGLIYSRLLGGADMDRGYSIAVQSGLAYLTGITYSNDFPGGANVGIADVFVAKLNSNGTINYSKTMGGNQVDAGFGIAVNSGVAWVTGETWSANYFSGFKGLDDAFVMSVSSSGTVLTRRAYGGTDEDYAADIVLDGAGQIYLTGSTKSNDFPFTEGSRGLLEDAYLLQLNSTNTAVLYAAPLGGSGLDRGKSVGIDSTGGVVVAGLTQSSDLPVTSDAYQLTIGGSGDAFVTRYFLAGSAPGHRTYSTYLGGSGFDEANALALDSTVFAYLVGSTQSANFPTTVDGLYRTLNGSQDAFLSVVTVGPAPTVSIQKFTNGDDANDEPGPYLYPGAAVAWRYDVMNSGAVRLTSVQVTDNKGVTISCPKTVLEIGESMTCTANGTATKGQYANLGTVIANTPYGTTVGDVDASHYFGADPRTVVVKKTNGSDANTTPGVYLQEGSAVNWTYEITNSGNVDLTNVTVVDNNGTPSNPADDVTVCIIPLLAAGSTDTTSCALSGTARPGQYTNIAVVTGTPPGGLTPVTANDPSNYFGSAPGITLTKKTNGAHITAATGPYLLVGSTVNWTYELQNTGNVALTNVTVVDDNGTPANLVDDRTACTIPSLAAGASDTTSCHLSGTATAGQYHNIATVSGTPPVAGPTTASDDSFYFGASPSVGLEFLVNDNIADTSPGLYVTSGSSLTMKYQVSNTGNVPLTNLVVTEGATPICTIPSLGVGASQTCQRIITALTGQQNSTASVTATPPSPLTNVTATDPMFYFGATPSMSLAKKTNNQDAETEPGVYVLAGSTVNWTYLVTNTGNVPLQHVTVVDDNGTPLDPVDDKTPAGCSDISLAVGANVTCSLSATAQVGQYTNVATATAAPPAPLTAIEMKDTSHYFGTTLSVTLAKQTNGLDAETGTGPLVAVGGAITWTYTVTNNSNVAVGISVVDDNGTPGNPADDVTFCTGSLAVGANRVCTRNGTALAGQYANTAVATATPPAPLSAFTVSDISHYFGVTTGIDLVKSTNGQDANTTPGPYIKVGDPVTWTYLVTNTGNVNLTGISLTDDKLGAITCPQTSLAGGGNMTCTASGIAVEGQYANSGTVTGQPPAPFAQVTDSDLSHYYGSTAGVSLTKLTNGLDVAAPTGPYIKVGDPVTWSYVVTNTGNIPLVNIVVTDNQPGVTVSCPPLTELAPGNSTTCTATGTAQAGQYTNIGSVSAQVLSIGGTVYATDTSYYFGANPQIQIVKKTNGQDANTPPGPYIPVGGTASFSYEITNTGNMALSNVVVRDDTGVVAACGRQHLNETIAYTCENSATALAGQQLTTGSVTADSAHNMGSVSAQDLSYYFGYTLGLALSKYTNGVQVTAPPGPELLAGMPVTWTYTVTNSSNVTLPSITVVDNTGVSVSCPKDTLAVGESMTCSASGTTTVGQYQNIGTASGFFEGVSVNAQDASYYYGLQSRQLYLPIVRR